MKRLLKIIPKEKKSITDGLILPLSKDDFIELNKKNLFLNSSLKELNKFIIQSLIYIPLSYNLNELNIVLIDFNQGNKPLYTLTSLDTIKYVFLEPEAIDLSVSLDELDKDKKTIFFIFEREDMDSVDDYEFVLKDDISNLSKNDNFIVITMSTNEKKRATANTASIEITKTKFALEKDFIPDFFLKINQDINSSVLNVMNYRRSRVSYLKDNRLI